MTNLKKIILISNWISIAFSPVAISMIPFVVIWAKYGLVFWCYLFPFTAFFLGIFFAEKVRKRKGLEEYSHFRLDESPDIIQTWEKELNRQKNDKSI